jgi:23S rRNA maturation-related 3'-5' exoribonuclease YhaM
MVLAAKEDVTKPGKRYYKLQLKYPKEAGGTIVNGVMWEEVLISLEGKKIPLPVSGQIWETAGYEEGQFDGNPQLTVRTYKVADSTKELKEKFRDPHVINPDKAIESLFDWIWWESDYKTFFKNLKNELTENNQLEDLKDCPAGSSNHHNRRGGLLQHVTEMVSLAETLCGISFEKGENNEKYVSKGIPNFDELDINFPLLRAAIILHDMGKIHDYSMDTLQWGADLEGKLLQHSQWGILAIERNWPSNGNKQEKYFLQHAVLTHHGRSVAPVTPQTPEAMMLHQIDALSAYLDVHRTAKRLVLQGKSVPYNSMMGETPLVPNSCN